MEALVQQGLLLVQMSLVHLRGAEADAQTVHILRQRGGSMHLKADGRFRRSESFINFPAFLDVLAGSCHAPVYAPPRGCPDGGGRHHREMHLQIESNRDFNNFSRRFRHISRLSLGSAPSRRWRMRPAAASEADCICRDW